jgi:hypothetical protein
MAVTRKTSEFGDTSADFYTFPCMCGKEISISSAVQTGSAGQKQLLKVTHDKRMLTEYSVPISDLTEGNVPGIALFMVDKISRAISGGIVDCMGTGHWMQAINVARTLAYV